jgi:uncharacterized Zn finger protein (UPF0148 family)
MSGRTTIRLELKYCEQCGGLLLRRTGEAVVFCASCARRVKELPVARKRGPAKQEVSAMEAGMLA